jgi:hypothetical protein
MHVSMSSCNSNGLSARYLIDTTFVILWYMLRRCKLCKVSRGELYDLARPEPDTDLPEI